MDSRAVAAIVLVPFLWAISGYWRFTSTARRLGIKVRRQVGLRPQPMQRLEGASEPHAEVRRLYGGDDLRQPLLDDGMTDPETAALDNCSVVESTASENTLRDTRV